MLPSWDVPTGSRPPSCPTLPVLFLTLILQDVRLHAVSMATMLATEPQIGIHRSLASELLAYFVISFCIFLTSHQAETSDSSHRCSRGCFCWPVEPLACRPTKYLQRPVGMKLLVHTRELRLCFLSGCGNSKSTPEATLPTVGCFVFSCCWLSVQR